MRLFRSLAAAALVTLVLSASGCKPSSLTPFGIGTRAPETSSDSINGIWAGTTSTGGTVGFQVGSNKITNLVVQHRELNCPQDFSATTSKTIVDDAFSYEIDLTQGRVTIEGRFTSTTTCSGTYFFEGVALTGTCPTSGSGSFAAAKSL